MKKIMFVLAALLMASPAMASVDITCAAGPGPNDVTVSFTSSEANNVRAFALDISTNDPCAWIAAVDCNHVGYGIYPGTIVIDDAGVVTDDGTCVGDPAQGPAGGTLGGLDTNGVTIEMGSLYEVGVESPPVQSGILVIVTLGGCDSGDDGVDVSIAENSVRGGVVMENPDEVVTVNATGLNLDMDNCAEPGCATCQGDISGDSFVTTQDLGMMIGALTQKGIPYIIPKGDPLWNDCGDLSGDDFMTTQDLGMLIGGLTQAGVPYIIPCPGPW